MTQSKNKKIKNFKEYKFIDLFAGIGGTRIAFEKNKAKCVFSSEWDTSCQKTYYANFNEIPKGDITKINLEDIKKFNILVAGFPCQPFSSIGKRQGFKHPTQGTLFHNIIKILKHHKPSSFLLENVSGLVSHDKKNTYKIIMNALDEAGYWVFTDILNASDYEVPQNRKRIYLVGFSKKLCPKEKINFKFPKKSKRKRYINEFIEEGITDRPISKHLQKSYIYKIKDGRPQVINKNSKVFAKTLVASYHKIQRLTGTFVKDGPTGLRLLTENECKAIMGFDKKFVIPNSVSRTQMYRQFGNSVAIPVVEKIAKKLIIKLRELNI